MHRLAILLVPGWAQARRGRRRRGLAIAAAALLLLVATAVTPWLHTPAGLVSFLLVAVLGACASSRDARRLREPPVPVRPVDAAVLLLPVVLVLSLASPWVRREVLGLQVFRIPEANESNAPTLVGGERFLARMRRGDVARGGLALFEAPGQEGRVYVKRIVALPGEVVRGGADGVFVDGCRVSAQAVDEFGPVEVGEGEAFALGDNPGCSRDSRDFGPVPIDAIIGRPLYVVLGRTCERTGKSLP